MDLYNSFMSNAVEQATPSICCARTSIEPSLSGDKSKSFFSSATNAAKHSTNSNRFVGTKIASDVPFKVWLLLPIL